jgi:hypothetical protein
MPIALPTLHANMQKLLAMLFALRSTHAEEHKSLARVVDSAQTQMCLPLAQAHTQAPLFSWAQF